MIDILTIDNDLQIANNDIVIGYSNAQHIEHLLVTLPATLLEDETVGVDLENYINDNDEDGMILKIQQQLTKDGAVVNNIFFDEQTGDLFTDANYPN